MSLGVPGNPGTPGSFTADEIEVNGPWRRLKKKNRDFSSSFFGFFEGSTKVSYIYIYIHICIHTC